MSGGGVVVTRWRRYGHDRLYVRAPDGTDLGWWDLTTGQAHARTPQREATVTAAATSWLTEHGGAPPPTVRQPSPSPAAGTNTEAASPVAPERQVFDLAYLRPGAAARARAIAEQEAARARTLAAREAASPVRRFFTRLLGSWRVETQEERSWRIGADGEEAVGAQLERLLHADPRWRVLHSIPVGTRGSDIDHVVIGPGGVYTVNAKHHPRANIWVGGNAFLVNGNKQPYIRNSRHEASRAARLLTTACGFSVHVEAAIVPVNARTVTVKNPPKGIHVVTHKQFVRWLLRQEDFYPQSAVDSLYAAARRSTTWQP